MPFDQKVQEEICSNAKIVGTNIESFRRKRALNYCTYFEIARNAEFSGIGRTDLFQSRIELHSAEPTYVSRAVLATNSTGSLVTLPSARPTHHLGKCGAHVVRYIVLGVVAFWLLVAAVLMVMSYRSVDAGALIAFGKYVAHSQPECQDSRVQAALERSIQVNPRMISNYAMAHGIDTHFMGNEDRLRGRDYHLVYLQSDLWLELMLSNDELVAAHCVLGGSGRPGYGLVKVGAVVGLSDLPHAPPRKLQALTDIFINDLRYHRSDDDIRSLYLARLNARQ